MRRFVTSHVPPVGEFVSLDEEVSHHLLRVTGIAPGEQVELFDGAGVMATAELCDVEEGLARLRIVAHVQVSHRKHRFHLLIAQLRSNTLDTVLRMATELGVTDVTVVQSERCVARGDKRERWLRVVQSAATQCGRSEWPTIHQPRSLQEVLDLEDGVSGVLCDPGAMKPVGVIDGPVCLLIGPEGGWTDQERSQAIDAGWSVRGLGPTTLRADTAAVAAISRCLV